jgi:hypothetical protein
MINHPDFFFVVLDDWGLKGCPWIVIDVVHAEP